jgi:hypothetical protein
MKNESFFLKGEYYFVRKKKCTFQKGEQTNILNFHLKEQALEFLPKFTLFSYTPKWTWLNSYGYLPGKTPYLT